MKNAVIDAVQALAGAGGPQRKWEAAIRLCREVELDSMLVAKVDVSRGAIHWINTNMPDAWMEEYLHEGYAEADPVLNGLSGGTASMTIRSGFVRRDDHDDVRVYNLNHGLKSSGIGSAHCLRYGAAQGPAVYATLAAAGSAEQMLASSPLDLQVLGALFAPAVDVPVKSLSNSIPGVASLSQRQREVLSLLAEGHQAARIADRLGITEAAVNKHFAAARVKLGASTREHALAMALQRGLISL